MSALRRSLGLGARGLDHLAPAFDLRRRKAAHLRRGAGLVGDELERRQQHGTAEVQHEGEVLNRVESEAQKAEFYKTCYGISQDEALCTCKADAAMSLIDEDFMGMVIASMKGKSPPADSYKAYNEYVARSNQVCKPNY